MKLGSEEMSEFPDLHTHLNFIRIFTSSKDNFVPFCSSTLFVVTMGS